MTERLTDSELEEMRERCAEADMRSATITDPPTVLALVQEVRRLREDFRRYREALEKIAASDAKRRDVVDLIDLAITALEAADE